MKLTKKEIELQLIGAREELKAKQQTVDYLQSELDALPKVPERWRAENGKIYWITGATSTSEYLNDTRDGFDNDAYKLFNYYRTEAEAERIAKVQLAYRTLDWAMKDMELSTKKGWVFAFVHSYNKLIIFTDSKGFSPLPGLSLTTDAEYIIATYPNELRTFLKGGRE